MQHCINHNHAGRGCVIRPHGPRLAHQRIVPGRLRSRPRASAIGFDFGDRHEYESESEPTGNVGHLSTLASSLLVFQNVMRGAVGEALLSTVAASQKFQAPSKDILAAYGKFYNLLLTSGYDSWKDYVLDQILLGRDNAFARAVAQGTLDSGEAGVLRAAAHDLDVLQEVSLPLEQLAAHVADVAPVATHSWAAAASDASVRPRGSTAPQAASGHTPGRACSSSSPEATPMDMAARAKYIQRPPTTEELARWKVAIANSQGWGAAVDVLRQYYHLHGFGITSRNTALRWSKGALEEVSEGNPRLLPRVSALERHRRALAANTAAHCSGAPAEHVLLAGPSGSGKSWLLWESTLAAGKEQGLRLVDVSGAETGSILEAARGCGRYPRLRFILVADHVDFPLRGAAVTDLMAGLSATGPSGWPTNTLLYMGVTPTSTVTRDPLVSRFGLVLATEEQTPQEFATTLGELAAHACTSWSPAGTAAASEGAMAAKGTDVAAVPGAVAGTGAQGSTQGSSEVDANVLAHAAEWARGHGGHTLRTAAQYVRKHLQAGP